MTKFSLKFVWMILCLVILGASGNVLAGRKHRKPYGSYYWKQIHGKDKKQKRTNDQRRSKEKIEAGIIGPAVERMIIVGATGGGSTL